jgi:signal transduction histidine kinase
MYSDRLRTVFEGGPPVVFSSQIHQHIVPVPWQDDRMRVQHTTVTSVPASEGEGFHALFAIQDVTDLTHRIQQYRAMRDQALEEARERKRAEEALRQRTTELEIRNEELDAFAHTVAHDLKSPLAHILGFAQALEQDCTTLSDEELCRYLNIITQSGNKMSSIIDALLLLSSVRKMDEVDSRPVDMGSIVNEACQRLAPMIKEYQAELILPDSWPVVLGYGPWVEEVWVNYISNALKYGGRPPRVELGADAPPASPPPVGTEGGETIRFWVRDNGPGIPPKDQARLFTPFTRLGQVRAKGHGLGLSIVRRIVEKLGGQVSIESRIGQGSTFSFTLQGYATEIEGGS